MQKRAITIVIVLIVIIALAVSINLNQEDSGDLRNIKDLGGFCGPSIEESCTSDEDCVIGGCSSHVCGAKSGEPIITTCEYTECYSREAYGVSCGCVNNKCQWYK